MMKDKWSHTLLGDVMGLNYVKPNVQKVNAVFAIYYVVFGFVNSTVGVETLNSTNC